MHLPFLSSKPPIDEESIHWIFDVFAWALRNLNAEFFQQDTILVTPSNEHFPGRASSAEEMARLMFDRTRGYAGMSDWPISLAQPQAGSLSLELPLSHTGSGRLPPAGFSPFAVGYDPAMINNPEAMISGFAQLLAHHLGRQVSEPVPGGMENWPHITELLGVFLGFGVLFANTAYKAPRGGCGGGSCGPIGAERQVALSQYHINYALALFCELKNIPTKQVLPSMKSSLRGHFKQCRKELAKRSDALQKLREIKSNPISTTAQPQTGNLAFY